MQASIVAVAAVLGAAIGSFLNVVIHRVPLGRSVVRPASACPSCDAPIAARDNVPVLSYFALRGRCRHCGARISPRYPVVELTNAILWVAAALRFEDLEKAAFVAVTSSVLLALAVIDLDVRRLPNVIVVPGAAVAAAWILVVGVVRGDVGELLTALLSGAVAFAIFFVIALVSGGMGFGDVKLAALVGIVTGRFGAEIAAVAIVGSFFIGGLVASVLLITGRSGRKDAIPFGPSLALGCILALFFGRGIANAWLGL